MYHIACLFLLISEWNRLKITRQRKPDNSENQQNTQSCRMKTLISEHIIPKQCKIMFKIKCFIQNKKCIYLYNHGLIILKENSFELS